MSGTVAWGEEEKDKIKILSHESIIAECNKQHSDLLIMDVIYSLLVFAVTVAIEALLICNISNFVGNFEDGGFVFVIKLIVIILGVICIVPLTPILSAPELQPAFEQILPALFGGLGVAFVSKCWKIAVAPVALMLVLFIFVPALNSGTVGIMVPVSVVFTIAVSRILYKKGVL